MSKFLFVDSHCHLDRIDLTHFEGNLHAAIVAAQNVAVGHFLNVCIHPDNFSTLLQSAEKNKDISVSVGLHPTESIANEPSVTQIAHWAEHPSVVAIGETGLDYYHKGYDINVQKKRFRNHIQAAKQVNKPLIIHTRNAVEDTLTLLKEEKAAQVGGVLHCFTESLAMAQYAIEELNFYISFSGILTFKNSIALKNIAYELPLKRLLIETDSPYLAPVPYRGRSNQPAYIPYVAQALADVKQLTIHDIGWQTTKNFFDLFRHASR